METEVTLFLEDNFRRGMGPPISSGIGNNAAEIGDNITGINDNATGIGNNAAKVIP